MNLSSSYLTHSVFVNLDLPTTYTLNRSVFKTLFYTMYNSSTHTVKSRAKDDKTVFTDKSQISSITVIGWNGCLKFETRLHRQFNQVLPRSENSSNMLWIKNKYTLQSIYTLYISCTYPVTTVCIFKYLSYWPIHSPTWKPMKY